MNRFKLALAALLFVGSAALAGTNDNNQNGNGGPMGVTFSGTNLYTNTSPVTVANLPACVAGLLGYHAFVSDGNAPAFNTVVAGGGAVFVEVHCTYATAGTFRWVGY